MNAEFIHKEAAKGKWQEMSLEEQLGNIGSEVGRAAKWQGKNEEFFQGAADRALELFDLTLTDPRLRSNRLREVAITRELFCDALFGGEMYGSSLQNLEKYFFPFAILAQSSNNVTIHA